MPRLSLEIPHALAPDEVIRRLEEKFSLARRMYQNQVSDLKEQWSGDTYTFGFKAVGMKIAGTIQVTASAVKVATDLPLAAMLFKKPIEQRVRQDLGTLLA